MAKIVDLPSGAKLEITLAGFEEGEALTSAVAKEIEGIKLSSNINFSEMTADTPMTGELLDVIKSLVARVLYSKEIKSVLWQCMSRATRNNIRVTKEMFDDEKVREDYIPIMREVLIYNLTPFFKNLGSLFTGIAKAV